MRHAFLGRLVICLYIGALGVIEPPSISCGQSVAVRKPLKALVESITEYLGKRGTRESAKELASLGGESTLRELLERTGREGGDEAVERLIRLAKNVGPEAIRAAENAPNASIVIRAIDDLPANLAERAAKRLAAGSEGRALAETVEEFGANALEAEVRHPGVGGRLVATLGGDGADLASRAKRTRRSRSRDMRRILVSCQLLGETRSYH